jgi:hypothetical protein
MNDPAPGPGEQTRTDPEPRGTAEERSPARTTAAPAMVCVDDGLHEACQPMPGWKCGQANNPHTDRIDPRLSMVPALSVISDAPRAEKYP